MPEASRCPKCGRPCPKCGEVVDRGEACDLFQCADAGCAVPWTTAPCEALPTPYTLLVAFSFVVGADGVPRVPSGQGASGGGEARFHGRGREGGSA